MRRPAGKNGRGASCVRNTSIFVSDLHSITSSRTKCRRLSSRLFPSFTDAALVRVPREGGNAAADELYQLGANVPPSAATRHGPTWYGPPFGRKLSRGAGGVPAIAA